MVKRKLNKEKTIQAILDKCNSSIGFSINVDKFNKMPKTNKFLKECCSFCEVKAVYDTKY